MNLFVSERSTKYFRTSHSCAPSNHFNRYAAPKKQDRDGAQDFTLTTLLVRFPQAFKNFPMIYVLVPASARSKNIALRAQFSLWLRCGLPVFGILLATASHCALKMSAIKSDRRAWYTYERGSPPTNLTTTRTSSTTPQQQTAKAPEPTKSTTPRTPSARTRIIKNKKILSPANSPTRHRKKNTGSSLHHHRTNQPANHETHLSTLHLRK